jgi:hypothetical protein
MILLQRETLVPRDWTMEAWLRLSHRWGHCLGVECGLGAGGWQLLCVVTETPLSGGATGSSAMMMRQSYVQHL